MRLLAKLLTSLLIVLVVALCTVLTVLHTSYGLPMVQRVVSTLTPYQLNASALEYDILSPFSIAFDEPELLKDNRGDSVAFLSFTVSPLDSLTGQLTLRSLVIRGATFNDTLPEWVPNSLTVKHIALDDLAYDSDALSFSQADVQLSDWENSEKEWGTWNGKFQFSAPQISLQGQTLSNFLLDSEKRDDTWEVWGLSFNSVFGNVTGSATLDTNNHWTIHQLGLSDARIEPSEALSALSSQWQAFSQHYSMDIRRLDLLDVSAEMPTLSIDHLNLSAQSITVKNGQLTWANTNVPSLLSFNANLLRYDTWVLTDALGEFSLSPDLLRVNAFSSKINDEGFISFAGDISKARVQLQTLVVNGFDLTLQAPLLTSLNTAWSALDDVQIASLSVRHTNVTVPDVNFPLQLIGINLRGNALSLREKQRSGMWQGDLTVSMKAASVNRVSVSAPHASMSVNDGAWQLDALSLSFPQGQLNATAKIDLANPSRPWEMKAQGLSIPTSLYQRWFGVYLPLSGDHDVYAAFSGLAASNDSFAYSLTGTLNATPHRVLFSRTQGTTLSQDILNVFTDNERTQGAVDLPLVIGDIAITADRGRIQITPMTIEDDNEKTELSGEWDLVTQDGALSNKTISANTFEER
ncbi:AsmA family protein [Enterovibrio baiacu]|uniref:AsmA family protein n=1 Tax=Enterovibrio baiacu TaxID=2491023 RepID=UPI003D097482